MLASMSDIDPRADAPLVDWSDLGVSGLLPTGTVTLLLADVEGSTRLWETQPEEMTAAIARLNQVVSDVIAAHDGVRPVKQGEGDSFVAAFARASDAVAAALELQRAPLAPVRLRIGVDTGEVQLRDEGNYAGPTINRTARLRDLAHGGQTVLSGVTEGLVVDRLPEGAWLTDLGSHPLRDLPRPERVVQLCHPDLVNEFPPLRVSTTIVSRRLPVQLTSLVGREAELTQVRELLVENRLVTLTGAGGVGKTRLAVQVAAQMADEFSDGVWYVDLAPITDPEVVPTAAARAFGLPDQPGRSTMDTLIRFVADRQMRLDDTEMSARERLLAIFDIPRSEVMRGCAFHNAAVESAGSLARTDEIVRAHKVEFTRRLVAVAREAHAADPHLLGHQLAVLFEGAAAMATSMNDTAPVVHARTAAATLIDAATAGSRG